jgi:hypothetical protein
MTALRIVRTLLILEAAAFAAASLTHFGILLDGFEDSAAGTAEGIIGAVLLLGWIGANARPAWTRPVAIGAQAFALAGTLIGLTLVIRGVGPSTLPDLVFHLGIAIILAVGLVLAVRARSSVQA